MAYNNNYYYDQSYDNYWEEDYDENSYYDDSYDYWNDEDYWYQGNEEDYSLEQYGNEYPYDNSYDQSYYGEQYGYDANYAQSRGLNDAAYYNNGLYAYNQDSYNHSAYDQGSYHQEFYTQQHQPSYYEQRGIYRMSSQRSVIHMPITTHPDIPGLNSSVSEMMHHTESMQPAGLATSVSQMINHTEQHVQPTFISGAVGSSRALDAMSLSQNLQQPSISPVQAPVRPASSQAILPAAPNANGVSRALDINRAQSVRVQMPPLPPASNQQTHSPIDVFHKMFWKRPNKLSPQMPRSPLLNRSKSARSLRSPGGLPNGQSNFPSPPLPAPPLPAPRPVGGGLPSFAPNTVPGPAGGFGFLAPRTP